MSETQQASREVSEMVIARQTGSRVERADNRTDHFFERQSLMNSWGKFLILKQTLNDKTPTISI